MSRARKLVLVLGMCAASAAVAGTGGCRSGKVATREEVGEGLGAKALAGTTPETTADQRPTIEDPKDSSPAAIAARAREQARQLDAAMARKANPSAVSWGGDPAGANPPTATAKPRLDEATAKVRQAIDGTLDGASGANVAVRVDNPSVATNAAGKTPADKPTWEPLLGADGAQTAAGKLAPADSAIENRLVQRLTRNPKDLAAQLDRQILRYLREDSAPESAAIAALPEDEREIVAAVVDMLVNLRAQARSEPGLLMGKKIKPVIETADRLRGQAELSVSTIALATEVKGFGVYEAIESPRFVVGQGVRFIVYCELTNFASQLTQKNRWETRLTQDVTLYTEAGLEIRREKRVEITDEARSRRQDFFTAQIVQLPPTLTPGRYTLKTTVIDQQGNRVAEKGMVIELVAR